MVVVMMMKIIMIMMIINEISDFICLFKVVRMVFKCIQFELNKRFFPQSHLKQKRHLMFLSSKYSVKENKEIDEEKAVENYGSSKNGPEPSLCDYLAYSLCHRRQSLVNDDLTNTLELLD